MILSQLTTSGFSLVYGIFQYVGIDFRKPIALIAISSLNMILLLVFVKYR